MKFILQRISILLLLVCFSITVGAAIPTVEEMWEVIQQQQKIIEELKTKIEDTDKKVIATQARVEENAKGAEQTAAEVEATAEAVENLYKAYKYVSNSAEYENLSIAQQSIIKHDLRDFRLSGIDLDKPSKQKFLEIQQELSRLQTKFEENLLDATHAWKKHITDVTQLKGMPDSAILLAEQNAQQENLDGWLLTLDFPSYMPVLKYADDTNLRMEIYAAYVTRASDRGPYSGQWDNTETMQQIMTLRHQLSKLLGFDSYAHYSLTKKMAETPDKVMSFLKDLASRSKDVAMAELGELTEFAISEYGVSELNAWDIAYYSEKLRQKKFGFSQEELRPYFSVQQVLTGLFAVVNKLYDLEIKALENIDVWHPDVRFF